MSNMLFQSGEVLVERCYHRSLHEVAAQQHCPDLVLGQGVDFDILVGIEVLSGGTLHANGEEAMTEVVHRAGVAVARLIV